VKGVKTMKKITTISIILKQGIIQDVVGMSKKIRIRVLDFDFMGAFEDKSISLLNKMNVYEEIWPKEENVLNQENNRYKKLSACIPDSCPECGCSKDNYVCRGLQATSSGIQTVDDKNDVILPSSLDMTDWSVTPVIVYCGECGLLILDRRFEVAKTILIWEMD
jgi:hypothetical protein